MGELFFPASRNGEQEAHLPNTLLVKYDQFSHEQWKKPWLFRVCGGFYYPVIYGDFNRAILRIPIKQPV